MYLTYEEYKDMGGTLNETAFNNVEFEARALIDWYTFNRLQNDIIYPEAVKRCVFNLVNIAGKKQQAFSLGQDNEGNITSAISSQSNDGVSISYNTMNASEAFKVSKNEMITVINQYLQGVTNELGRKLLYRGLYPGE